MTLDSFNAFTVTDTHQSVLWKYSDQDESMQSSFKYRSVNGMEIHIMCQYMHHINEQVNEIMVLCAYASTQGSDEPVQTHSLARSFAARAHKLDKFMPKL